MMTGWTADLRGWDQLTYPDRKEAGSMLLFCPSSSTLFFSLVDNWDNGESISARLDLVASRRWRQWISVWPRLPGLVGKTSSSLEEGR